MFSGIDRAGIDNLFPVIPFPRWQTNLLRVLTVSAFALAIAGCICFHPHPY